MRPRHLADFVGQEHLAGENRLIARLLAQGWIPSLLFWGPPGCGKTTLAAIIASELEAEFFFFSAVLSGVKDLREVIAQAREKQRQNPNRQRILFVDEIHRFNRSQQDGFLPHVENGLLTLVGATTENPSFHIISPLLSRCQILIFNPLTERDIITVLKRAVTDRELGLGKKQISVPDEGLEYLAALSDGDCRRALNCLETATALLKPGTPPDQPLILPLSLIKEAAQQIHLRYDRAGEEHYNLVSALHKSLRDSDPDGAGYWLRRMLKAGEDPLYIARRLIRFASEDIGNADPRALSIAIDCRQAYHVLGSPEGELALLQAAVYLATAPKSNALYRMEQDIDKDILQTGSLAVPLHLRNAPTRLMRKLGYGRGYQYAHDSQDSLVDQQHLPDRLDGRRYYHPTNRGYEAIIADRLRKWHTLLRQRAINQKEKNSNDRK